MAEDLMGYNVMVEEAMRGVVRQALGLAVQEPLPGDHHFYVTFRTDMDGVILPDHLHARYPREMTIVLQHQFWNLEVTEDAIEVDLSFNQKRERLRIPMEALITFADPSVNFAVQFSAANRREDEDEEAENAGAADVGDGADSKTGLVEAGDFGDRAPTGGPETGQNEDGAADAQDNVVTLDAFRKK